MNPIDPAMLPQGVRSRFLDGINGLRMHVLEAGFEAPGRPLLLLLHGFPELAWSWRKVMGPLAEAGYHVVAPDQRGYGRTSGWSADFDADLAPFRMLNLARDAIGLVAALGHRTVACVVGHDFGASVAGWSALVRPDVYRRLVLMSAPFTGVPPLPLGATPPAPPTDIHAALAALDRPRKHYQWYYSTRAANADMHAAPQGVHAFLRAYYHHKSADWPGDGTFSNTPAPLGGWTAAELARLPTYYVMDMDKGMAATVASEMPSAAAIADCAWLPDAELAVYSAEFARTGFQGGLNWYRARTTGQFDAEHQLFAGRTIDVPSLFIAGAQDWGIHQSPGAITRMRSATCTAMRDVHLVAGAGHWVQQEQPAAVRAALLAFLAQSPQPAEAGEGEGARRA